MANISDKQQNHFMLRGPLGRRGYDWWWHSFTAEDAETGEEKPFFIEYFTCNPALAGDAPVLGPHFGVSFLSMRSGAGQQIHLSPFFPCLMAAKAI